jgi:hypothetical protein
MGEQVEQAPSPVQSSPQGCDEKPSILTGESLSQALSETPWSIFNKREMAFIVILGSLAAFLSPLTAKI